MADEKATAIARIVERVMGILGVPIRGLLTTIGHSTVTAWTVVAIAGVVSAVYWTESREALEGPAIDALRREREAQARWYELKNAEVEQKSPAMQWRILAANAGDAGLVLQGERVEGATAIIASWRKLSAQVAEGVVEAAIPSGTTGTFSVAIPSEAFGDAWQPDASFNLDVVEQVTPAGKATYAGRQKSFRVPSTPP